MLQLSNAKVKKKKMSHAAQREISLFWPVGEDSALQQVPQRRDAVGMVEEAVWEPECWAAGVWGGTEIVWVAQKHCHGWWELLSSSARLAEMTSWKEILGV